MVMPVGNTRPETIVLTTCPARTCTIWPEPGVGPPAVELNSSAYSLPPRNEPDHLLEAVRAHPDVPVRVELVDVLVARAFLGVEQPEVPDVKDAVVGNRRRD